MAEPLIALTLRMSPALHSRLRALADRQEVSVSDVLRQAAIKHAVEEERQTAPERKLQAA